MDRPSLADALTQRDSVLHAFVRTDGRLDRIPSKASKRLVVLDYVAQAFEVGRHYSEPAVDEILRGFHQDWASLRRSLIDEGFLQRELGTYWRSGGTVDA